MYGDAVAPLAGEPEFADELHPAPQVGGQHIDAVGQRDVADPRDDGGGEAGFEGGEGHLDYAATAT